MVIKTIHLLKQLPKSGILADNLITFESEGNSLEIALMTLVARRPDFHDHLMIIDETKAPVVFCGVALFKAEDGNRTSLEFEALTYREFEEKAAEITTYKDFDKFSVVPAKCKIIESAAGRAGIFFNDRGVMQVNENTLYDGGILYDSSCL